MNDLQQNIEFKKALAFHQSGNAESAKEIYLRLLGAYSTNPRLLNNLAMIEFQQGHFESGLKYVEKSLGLDSSQFAAYGNRGAALFALGRADEAHENYNKAINLNQNYAEAYYNRGILHEKYERLLEALKDYDKAIEIKSDYANAYNNRGNILKKLEKYDEALASYENAIKSNPYHTEAYSNRGVILKQLKDYPAAITSFLKAIDLNNNYADAYYNCGNTFIELNNFKDALTFLNKAILINPNYASAYISQGNVLIELKKFDEALISYDKSIALNSNSSIHLSKRSPEQKFLNVSSTYDLADTHWNKALLKILLGEYEQGWDLYEYRRLRKDQEKYYPNYSKPLWLGKESLNSKVLYLYPEQGLGDFIQFCRYILLVEKLGASVILRAPIPLISVINSIGLNARIVKSHEEVDSYDFHCPIMSLPLAFKTTLDNIPNAMPYLFSDAAKKNHWKNKMAGSTTLKVGLVWSGSKNHMKDQSRSLRLEQLKPLFDLPVNFYSLQKEVREEDQATLSQLSQIQQYSQELNDFSDTAAMVDNLDLIISVDTSVAHLAGAMAKNVWILISYLPDYRWMLDREDSPWYPTARLFRQPNIGDWESVIGNVKQALQALLAEKSINR